MALTFDDTQAKELLEALGLPDDADAATAVLAVQEVVTAPVDPAVAAKAGAGILVDPTKFEELKAAAAQGETLKAAAKKRDRDAALDKAFHEGRITPPSRAKWEQLLEADPSMASVMASLPIVVPLVEIGHSDPGIDGSGPAEPAGWIR